MTTLLVDDDPFALKVLARQLALLGVAQVTGCAGAREALELVEADASNIDLVFCDLQMPGMDGVEFVRHLARIGYRGSLVLVSAEDSRVLQAVHRLALAHGVGVLATLGKPVQPQRLGEVLAAHLDRERPAQGRPGHGPVSAEELTLAIEDGQLINHYQPKVLFSTGAWVGVEALVRWQHPVRGLVYPDQFITRAEELGLMDPLTRLVLRDALRMTNTFQQSKLRLQMAVNVSMDSLVSVDFPEMVERTAFDVAASLEHLILEVTESRLMMDIRAPLDILSRLRLKRIGLSIDDFGTGHSSLAQLRDFPFGELKIDRSFAHGAADDPSLRAIVGATLAMAAQLGMKSVAEGVEDLKDWNYLSAAGCDVAQGYFIARPMPGEALPAWHEGWQRRWRDGEFATAELPGDTGPRS
jgi:EAL domain-containing protein (putative c-di-GMP-specific phosphodiesterase class I)/ActR/RegA family two-component response regulator